MNEDGTDDGHTTAEDSTDGTRRDGTDQNDDRETEGDDGGVNEDREPSVPPESADPGQGFGGFDVPDREPSTDSESSGGPEPPAADEQPAGESPADLPNADEPRDDEPLGELAERTRRRREEGSDEDDLMDAFDAVEVDAIDDDRLWAELESGNLEETVDEPRRASERDEQEVGKRQYCQRCRYFSAPPEVRCTHEDGEILEVVDSDTFRVADCPILSGEEELEKLGK